MIEHNLLTSQAFTNKKQEEKAETVHDTFEKSN